MAQVIEILSIINAPGIQEFLFPVKIVFGGIGLLFFIFCAVVIFRTSWLKYSVLLDVTEFLTFRPFGLRRMTRRWNQIKDRLQTGVEAEYKLAVIEADSMISEVLGRMGFKGATLGDRLQAVTAAIIPNIEDLWVAHKTRNNVVHDPDYRLFLPEAEQTLAIYEKAFAALDLL
ncbi:MAG: hypothetical protein HY482_00280 [Candidatus Wildermuthbacteria bacterium]|nr:hypothetical protein [Candidatus Wildermuthbacteria bacterium]